VESSAFLATLRQKDPAVLSKIVNDYSDALLCASWGLGWRGTDAEDLVQETFVTFVQSCDRFEGRSTVKTYLFGILYNKTLEKRRDVQREQATDPIDDVFEERFGYWGIWRTLPRGPEEESQSKETLAMIEACVQALPTPQRMAFFLREVEHETTETLCNILDVSVTHLGVLLFRARNKVRECVQKKWGKR